MIGGGQAGLGISYWLQHYGLQHRVLEQGKIGETWSKQRWDSFALNSPNKRNTLPGETYAGENPDGFDSAPKFVSYLRRYADKFRLPVLEYTRVVSVEHHPQGFIVRTADHGSSAPIVCRQLVVASGAMNLQRVPSFAGDISPEIRQYHAGTYRNSRQLDQGAVLVVGSGQSGLQVAEDLLRAGRTVYLSTSAVGRVPRRYRGTEILEWLLTIGFYDVRTEDVTDPREFEKRQPQVSGVGPFGHTHSLQSLAQSGAVILGKLESASGVTVRFQPDAAANVRFADEVSKRIKQQIDDYIVRNRLDVPPNEPDPADEPDLHAACASPLTCLNLLRENIHSIVWTTGFSSDFRYLKLPVLDGNGRPRHRGGVSEVPGVYFLGLPWLRKRKSGIICGTCEDAEELAKVINSRARQNRER